MDDYEFVLWEAEGDRLVAEIEAQDDDFQEEFYTFVEKTARSGWLRKERLETLDGCFETYAFFIASNQPRVMLTRPTEGNRYTYLGLTMENDPKEAVYRAACKAHGLNNPRRTP